LYSVVDTTNLTYRARAGIEEKQWERCALLATAPEFGVQLLGQVVSEPLVIAGLGTEGRSLRVDRLIVVWPVRTRVCKWGDMCEASVKMAKYGTNQHGNEPEHGLASDAPPSIAYLEYTLDKDK
jgi:hypothetical protein